MLDVDDPIDHAIEKLAVVGDEQQRPGIVAQPVFQPQDGVEVEVVGRLVEQQEIGAAHERLRHVETNPPAARERAHRTRFIRRGEAESMQEPPGPAASVIPADACKTCMQLTQPMAVVAGFGLSDGALDGSQFRVTVQHEFDRGRFGGQQFLRDVGESEVRWHLERAGIGLQLTADQRQETGLAAAVLAGNADLLAAEQTESGAGKQDSWAAAQRHFGEIQHARIPRGALD